MEIYCYPDSVLRIPTEPVVVFDDGLKQLIAAMWETMHAKEGIGLAAPQVGLALRIAVISWEDQDLVLINPKITVKDGVEEIIQEEGCLSFPGIYEQIARPSEIEVTYLDEEGKNCHQKIEGFLARVVCHEVDHLNGRLLVDHISPLRRAFLKKRILRERKKS